MYKRFLLFLVTCLVLSVFISNAAALDNPSASNNIFLWKVSLPNSGTDSGTAYLFGIPDMDSDNILPPEQKVEKAYGECNRVIVNLDPAKVTEPQVNASLFSYGFLEKTSLDKILSPDTFHRADALIKKYTDNKKSLSDYISLKPWVIDALLMNLSNNSPSEYSASPLCKYFTDKAVQDKKDVFSMESVDYQFKLLGTLSYSVQIALLQNTLTDLEKETTLADTKSLAWRSSLLLPDFNGNTALRDSYNYMLHDRNEHAATCIKKLLKTGGNYFVIVDASQLVGQNSMQELLKSMGITVEQMKKI